MRAVASVLVGVVAADQGRVSLSKRMPVDIVAEAEHRERLTLGLAEPRRGGGALADAAEPARNRIERIREIAPFGWRICAVRGKAAKMMRSLTASCLYRVASAPVDTPKIHTPARQCCQFRRRKTRMIILSRRTVLPPVLPGLC